MIPIHAGVMELADVVDSKSTGGDTVPVRVRPPAPAASRRRQIAHLILWGALCFFARVSVGIFFVPGRHVGMDYAPFKIPSRMAGDFSYHYVIPLLQKKVTLHLRCSLVNALKTLRLAIHFLRDTCGAGISFITQTQTYGRQFVMSCRLFFIMPRHKWDPFRPTLIK